MKKVLLAGGAGLVRFSLILVVLGIACFLAPSSYAYAQENSYTLRFQGLPSGSVALTDYIGLDRKLKPNVAGQTLNISVSPSLTSPKRVRLSVVVSATASSIAECNTVIATAQTVVFEITGGGRALGVVQDLISICKTHPVDEVIFCPSKSFVAEAEKYFQDLEELGITTRVVLDFYDLQRSKRELSLFHDEIPILTFHTKSLDSQQLLLKRMLDVFGAIIGLFFAGVLYPLVALAIKVDTSGLVFFSQERVGVNGRPFRCWKFRSMSLDAEERREDLMSRNEMRGAIFKINDDPRITRIGRFLRKTSLDELPQFWNVLKGEMSLVGTRPPTPDEVSRYENWHRRRISIKPGITGLWQVSGRNQIVNFDEIVRFDLEYIDNWNLWLDAKILMKTLKVVFTREGSC